MARPWGSAGRNAVPASGKASSRYSTMSMDSHTGLPAWRRTGTFLWTGLEARSSSLLSARSSSTFSYSRPLRCSAMRTRFTNGLAHAPSSFSCPASPPAPAAAILAVCCAREWWCVASRSGSAPGLRMNVNRNEAPYVYV